MIFQNAELAAERLVVELKLEALHVALLREGVKSRETNILDNQLEMFKRQSRCLNTFVN